MTKSTAAVLADALRLDTPERAELAAELLGSPSGPADPRAEAAWDVEIDRRLAAITTGAAELESWESVKRLGDVSQRLRGAVMSGAAT